MPDMTPVAAGIVPPDPTQGINTFSGILGIKQRQQNLQTGAYTQASAQATAQQDQQKNSELQAAQSLVFNGSKSGKYTKADGSLDRQKMADDIATVAPTYGGTAATSLLSQANEIVSNQKAHQELSGAMQKQMGNTFASLASKKDLSNSDVVDAFEELRAANPAPEFSRMLTSMSTHLPPNASPQDLQALMGKWSAAATGEGQQAPSTIDTGGQIYTGTTNRFSGAFKPSGQGPIQKTLAPTDQPGYKSTVSNIPEDTQRFSEISKANQTGQSMVALSGEVSHLADQVRTGQLSKYWTDKLAILKQQDPNITSRQMLGKYAAQLKTMATDSAGTDAERAQVNSGMPDPDNMAPGTLKEAAQYIGGMGAMRQARSKVASTFAQKNGTTNGVRSVDDQFMQHADPFVFMYQNMPPGEQRKQFILNKFGDGKKVTDPDGAKKFKAQMDVVSHYVGQ